MAIKITLPMLPSPISTVWEKNYSLIIESWLHRICPGADVTGDLNPTVTMVGDNASGSCNCLRELIKSLLTISIIPTGPDYQTPNGKTIGEQGGGAVETTEGAFKNADGSPGPGPNLINVYIDITNNNGKGYPHGSAPWLILANLLASGSAHRFLLGLGERSPQERYSIAIDYENEVYRTPNGIKPRDEGNETPPEQDRTREGTFIDPYMNDVNIKNNSGDNETGNNNEGGNNTGENNTEGDNNNSDPETNNGNPPGTSQPENGTDPRDLPPPFIMGEELEDPNLPLCFIVPGFLASRLVDADGNVLWSLRSGIQHYMDTDLDNMYPGNPVQAEYAGDHPLTETGRPLAGYYSGLIVYLELMGYQLGRNLWVFTYNWTQSNEISGQAFLAFIEEKKRLFTQTFGRDPSGVHVIAHSMGGIVGRVAIRFGADIQKLVFLGSPHWGSPSAYFFLHPKIPVKLEGSSLLGAVFVLSGVTEGIIEAASPSYALQVILDGYYSHVKHFLSRLDSTFELLPDHDYLDYHGNFILQLRTELENGTVNIEKIPSVNGTYFGTADTNYQLPASVHAKVAMAMEVKRHIRIYEARVEYLNICSSDRFTPFYAAYNTNSEKFMAFNEKEGDATVPLISAGIQNPASASVWFTHYVLHEHAFLANDPVGHALIGGFFGLE